MLSTSCPQMNVMITGVLCLWMMTGCRLVPPANHADNHAYYMGERQGERSRKNVFEEHSELASTQYHGMDKPYQRYGMPLQIDVSTAMQVQPAVQPYRAPHSVSQIPLSLGDRVRIRIIDGEVFNGDYEVNLDGTLQLPFLQPIPVVGMTLADVEQRLAHDLVAQGFFLPHFVQVSVRHLLWGVAHIRVSGAVFQPGLHMINRREAQDRAQHIAQAGGDFAPDRTLTSALRAAGGVRPDADVQRVILMRGRQQWQVDLSGALDGDFVTDPPLASGDRVVVQSTGFFQSDLVRPSMITPVGARIYMSNLSIPADSNAKSILGHDQTQIPYGTRLLQGMVAANCVGGTDATNANRFVVLASYNPLTGQSEVIERSVEALIRRADRDEYNPYLLPGDALACYDSVVTGMRDIARTISNLLNPLDTLGRIPK